MFDYANARHTMIENQLRTYDVLDYNTLEAMGAVPRELFVPADCAAFAYLDKPVPLGQNRELMTPMVFGRLLQVLDIQKTDRVLDIAGGTGYSAAVFSCLAQHVVALEDDDAAIDAAQHNFNTIEATNITCIKGTIEEGAPKNAPFEVIFINGAIESEPKLLLKQLKDGGRLACVLGSGRNGRAVIYRRAGTNVTVTRIIDASAIWLTSFALPLTFKF